MAPFGLLLRSATDQFFTSDDLPTPDSGTYCPSLSEDTGETSHHDEHYHEPLDVLRDFPVEDHHHHQANPNSPPFERKIKKSTSLQFPR